MRVHYMKGEAPNFQTGYAGNVVQKKSPYPSELSLIDNSKCGQDREILRVYDKMREEGVRPSISIVVAALKVCSSLRELQTGKKIHADVIEAGNDSDIYVANTLIDMYAKCGSMVGAGWVFERMLHPDEVSWNVMIRGYAQSGKGDLALQLYARMQDEGCAPGRVTFLAALKACGSLAAEEEGKQVEGKLVKLVCLEKGKSIHSQVAKSGHELDIYVANTLLDMYAKCGSIVDARRVFDRMPHRNLVSWNAIILGYAQNGEGELALQLYARMQDEGCAPDRVTFVAALKACVSLAAEEEGKQVEEGLVKIGCLEKGIAIHSQVAKSGHELDIFVASTLVDMYAKCGSMVDARQVFDRMAHHDVVSWTAIILGFAQSGEGELALQLFARMQDEGCAPDPVTFVAALKACASLAAEEEGKQVGGTLVKIESLEKGSAIHSQAAKSGHELDIFVASSLIDMYAKCGSMMDAARIFERMPHHNVVAWTTMILGYAQSGEGEFALQLFACMQDEGCAPNARAFVAALTACTSLAMKEEGKQVEGKLVKLVCLEKGIAIHSQAAKSGHELDIYVAATVVDMYAKCGSMVDAWGVFNRLSHHNVVSWNAIILGYVQSGDGELALHLFTQMRDEGYAPDRVTFVAALKACGSLAALETGKKIQAEICSAGFKSDAVLANCLVDFYGKCGSMLMLSRSLIQLPQGTWLRGMQLIARYSCQGDTRHVFNLFERMQKERSQADGITFLSILTVCSHAGLIDKVCSGSVITPSIEHWLKWQ